MAKLNLSITDLPGGEAGVSLKIDNAGSLSSMDENTVAQNAAIAVAIQLREMGFKVEVPATETGESPDQTTR
ncbi:hypothetical protein EZI54_07065 [Marinobacter halodurans]|uniref:Uncharacterized protein n=1 Tax=Marinobacter halodurans TaxID=2528979 RepID=A0ABY1ZRG7_9GAMM|nr:hypothetical protein [Marinobacter halodurans]TBW57411.1 hypothetical protein EZI54_07065 [Marinobacter halodurans]